MGDKQGANKSEDSRQAGQHGANPSARFSKGKPAGEQIRLPIMIFPPLLSAPMQTMQYKISVLIFLKDVEGRFLMLQRRKTPNQGLWSPIGGKLEMATGESPFECAIREAKEEVGLELIDSDLHLFCMAAEKAYEGNGHWLMFLFECHKPLTELPPAIDEGAFAFHTRKEIETLPIPETDRQGLWDIYDRHHDSFVALKVDCHPGKPLKFEIEGAVPAR